MRLSLKEIQALKSSFTECLEAIPFKLYLFGSRLDDLKKGGDIDLLVVVNLDNKSKVVDLKNKIRATIFKFIPEQKIDITVSTEDQLSTDIFLKNIFVSAKELL